MEIVPVFVGLDYHSETIRVCVMDVEGEVLVNRSVANDPSAVVDLVRANGGLVRAVSIEACCGAAGFATTLAAMTEWTVRMAHPSGVNRMKNGPDKTDHTDRHSRFVRDGVGLRWQLRSRDVWRICCAWGLCLTCGWRMK